MLGEKCHVVRIGSGIVQIWRIEGFLSLQQTTPDGSVDLLNLEYATLKI